MDLSLSDEQRALAASARQLLQRECPIGLARDAARADGGRGFSQALWSVISAVGWTAVMSPMSQSSDRLLNACVLLEELGAVLAPVPFLESAVISAGVLASVGNQPELLAGIANGTRIVTLALNGGWPGETATATAVYTQSPPSELLGFDLEAEYGTVAWANVADAVICPASTAGRWMEDVAGDSMFLVLQGDFASEFLPNLAAAPWFRVACKTRLHASRLLTPTNEGSAAIELAKLLAAVGVAAEAVGVSRTLLDTTINYAKNRRQFGAPIGSFQAVQHRCVDMAAALMGGRLLMLQAAVAFDAGAESAAECGSLARGFASNLLRLCMHNAHQVHGAIGFSQEHTLPLFSRRARVLESRYGSASTHRRTAASAIIADVLSPSVARSSCKV